MAAQMVPRSGVLGDRTVATLVGVLYLTGTVAGVLSRVVTDWTGPEGPDYVASAASMGNRLPAGALLVLVMGVALAFIPILVYPILRGRPANGWHSATWSSEALWRPSPTSLPR